MLDRRRFIQSVLAGLPALVLGPHRVLAGRHQPALAYFDLHPFINANPSAVFIFRTTVDTKTNAEAIKQAGQAFASSVFLPSGTPGVPVTHRVVIKPNIVMMPSATTEYMGMVTDANFVEGVIESLKSLGLAGSQFYLREVNNPSHFTNSGYTAMALRTGADLRALDAPVGQLPESDIVWTDVPDGAWFSRLPMLWPVNASETILLNIAKLKTHSMGMSLCAKNLQGINAIPYVHHCVTYGGDMQIAPEHIQAGAAERIYADYLRHRDSGVPRWDRPGPEGGIWQETWAARCLDNNSVLHPHLNIIEGIYGREGAFAAGPGPDGQALDHMTNFVIFGKNAFHVDLIGCWLGGHEPGNFGLFHMALERGLAGTLNPQAIPLFEWYADGTCVRESLTSFPRFALRTQYLRRDYNGQSEPDWHLVDEEFPYTKTLTPAVAVNTGWNLLSLPLNVLDATVPNQFPSATSAAYGYDDGYVLAPTLSPGAGYWLKFPEAASVPLQGEQVSLREIPVKQGWNLVGPFDSDASTAAVLSTPEGILNSEFFGYENGYAVASVLHPGKGYWIKASQAGTLRLPSGLPRRVTEGTCPDRTRIDVADAAGHKVQLCLADDGARLGQLPPMPPEGIFDARFLGDRFVASRDSRQIVCLSSAEWPVVITVTNLRGRMLRITDGIDESILNVALADGGSMTIAQHLSRITVLVEGSISPAYELQQNYPNPFNGGTTIRFHLPESSRVSIDVFNTVGEKVRSLVDAILPEGSHSVRFEGAGLPSGAYFCRMSAFPAAPSGFGRGPSMPDARSTFVATRRMVFVR